MASNMLCHGGPGGETLLDVEFLSMIIAFIIGFDGLNMKFNTALSLN